MLYLITGEKGSGLLRQSAELIKTLGHNRLMVVSTIKGIDDHLKEVFESRNLNPEIYQVSEEYFEMRLNVKDLKTLKKLIKRIVNEIILNMRDLKVKMAVIYRTNDLTPVLTGYDREIIVEEFWRMFTADLRITGDDFILIYEKLDESEKDPVCLFVDVEIKITSKDRSPIVLREY